MDLRVAEIHQAFGHAHPQRQSTHHAGGFPFERDNLFSQIHQSAAFGVNRISGLRKLAHGGKHFAVSCKTFNIKFWVAPADIESIHIGRRSSILQRAEFDDLRAGRTECVEVIFVVEAKSPVAGYADADASRQILPALPRSNAEDGKRRQKLVQIDVAGSKFSQEPYLRFPQTLLSRSEETQMPFRNVNSFFSRQLAEHRRLTVFGNRIAQQTKMRRAGDVVEDDASKPEVRVKGFKSMPQRGRTPGRRSGIDDQNNR